MAKTRKLKLSYPHGRDDSGVWRDNLYQVEQTVDSTTWPPGAMMSQREVDDLCHKSGWQVTIVRAGARDAA